MCTSCGVRTRGSTSPGVRGFVGKQAGLTAVGRHARGTVAVTEDEDGTQGDAGQPRSRARSGRADRGPAAQGGSLGPNPLLRSPPRPVLPPWQRLGPRR